VMAASPRTLRGLRVLLAGGDVLSPKAVNVALRQLPCVLVNGYGPTENTTFTTCYTIEHCVAEDQSVPIGRPIANTRVYILDPRLEPVPILAWGELFTSGDGLATGYVNDAAGTAERFLPDPFSSSSGSRMYRTGDIARWRADGTVEFLGRRDAQVKIRGYRVEPAEVEAMLRRCPGVSDCAVLAHANGKDARLVAYVVAAGRDAELVHL